MQTTTTHTPKPASEPVLFQIWFRENSPGARWCKAGRVTTRAEALAMIGGNGDWHIAPLCDVRLAGGHDKAVTGSSAAGHARA